jgi:hypothetical protein
MYTKPDSNQRKCCNTGECNAAIPIGSAVLYYPVPITFADINPICLPFTFIWERPIRPSYCNDLPALFSLLKVGAENSLA